MASSSSTFQVLPGNGDARRCVANATARSQRLLESMLTRLQAYQTFQPILLSNELYAATDPLMGHTIHHISPSTMDGGAAPGGGIDPEAAARRRWGVIDEALDTASHSLLRHSYEDHFLSTMSPHMHGAAADTSLAASVAAGRNAAKSAKRVIEVDSQSRPPTNAGSSVDVGRGGGAAANTLAPATPFLPSSTGGASVVDTHRIVLDAWRRDHPNASPQEVAHQAERWRVERANTEREMRRRHLTQLKKELRVLVACDSGAATSAGGDHLASVGDGGGPRCAAAAPRQGPASHPEGEAGSGTDFPVSRAAGSKHEVEKEQRALWNRFHHAEGPVGLGTGDDGVRRQRSGVAPKVVYDYEQSAALHEWVQRGWHTHTHRHEDAALLIQRAFRAYLAKCQVDRRRSARARIFAEMLRAEDVAQQQWEIALRISATQAGNDAEAGRALRALQFFSNRVMAVAEVRRARRHKAEEEQRALRSYAATTIQRVYRGHRDRQRVTYLRHPSLWEAKRHAMHTAAALTIQRMWAGYTTRRWLGRRDAAVRVLQRAYRSHVARRRARHLRLHRWKGAAHEIRLYAVARIERCYLAYRQRK